MCCQYFEQFAGFYSNDIKVVFGDFNLEPSNPSMLSFMNSQNFVNLIKNKTCFKGVSCIDLILTNRKYSFKNTSSYEIGLGDHHHLILLSFWKPHLNLKNLKKIYRYYKLFSEKFP